MKTNETIDERKYETMFVIPLYLVQTMTDGGMVEWADGEKDDLHVGIELSGGLIVLLSGPCRLVVKETNIDVQVLS